MSKITVKNMSSATVVIALPEINFRRSLAPRREIPVTQEEYDNLSFDPGVQNMVRSGYIRFFGVEEGQEMEADNEAGVLEQKEIEDMIARRDITAFAKFIPISSAAAKDVVVQYMVENNVTDNAFAALVKKYCHVDIIDAITIKHKAEEKA